jgi:hypothetical protein
MNVKNQSLNLAVNWWSPALLDRHMWSQETIAYKLHNSQLITKPNIDFIDWRENYLFNIPSGYDA